MWPNIHGPAGGDLGVRMRLLRRASGKVEKGGVD
jgi:hypothetical protein